MRWFFRWLFRILILVVVLAIAAILLFDIIAREITRRSIEKQTGLEVKIGRMQVDLLDARATIENLVIYNSAQFGGSPFIEMPELHVEYEQWPVFGAKVHFKLIRLNLAKLNVVRDVHGKKNLDALEKRLKKITQADGSTANSQKNNTPKTSVIPGIDTLNLTLGRATYVDMKNPGKVEELKVDVRNQILTNIKTENDLAGVLMVILLKSNSNIFGNGENGVNWLDVFSPAKKINGPVKVGPSGPIKL